VSFSQERDPSAVPWAELGVAMLLECSGHYLTREALAPFFAAGIAKVVVSAACKGDILNIVYGCNHQLYDPQDPAMNVVTAASCAQYPHCPPVQHGRSRCQHHTTTAAACQADSWLAVTAGA
jgi:glyceraldehyde 3-phosphate dehydrogenase